jgi:hypothetical protein
MKIQAVQNEIDKHRQNWLNHLERMTGKGMPKQSVQHTPKGRRHQNSKRFKRPFAE